MRTIEILAPAGSYESMAGAFAAGADAVYMGGQRFGARAYADNPDESGLLSAIDEAHIHGKKLYLTVNTLFKDKELEGELYKYLEPLYRQGLDAVIVQDMGALCQIRQWFPDLDIHASTQMTVVSADHARSLKALGVTRIVPARELNLEEIRHLKDSFGGEIECFVHGALCYCYSGQCLLSSMLGGRSGNRGRCAQPCRLPYRLYEGKKRLDHAGESYLLSPKDICTLELIPELVEAGIDSFKIEGRMKKPEYAAFVSYVYRKYTDMYLNGGRENYRVDPEDIKALMDLYNRGGFSAGYYHQHNGRNMMSLSRPNHFGSEAGHICKNNGKARGNGRQAMFEPITQINSGDLLLAEGMDDKAAVTVKTAMVPGKRYPLAFGNVKPGAKVYRLRNEALLEHIKKTWLDTKNQEKIYISLTLLKELPAKMQITCGGFTIQVSGPAVEAAKKQPLTREVIEDKMKKTGNTPFEVAAVELHMDEDAYLPLTALNQLRRDGIEALTRELLARWRRELPDGGHAHDGAEGGGLQAAAHPLPERAAAQSAAERAGRRNMTAPRSAACGAPQAERVPDVFWPPQKSALVSELAAVPVVLESGVFSEIYLESWLLFDPSFEAAVDRIRESGARAVLAFPHIFREQSRRRWKSQADRIKCSPLSGYMVRNVESLEFIKDQGLLTEDQEPGEAGRYIIADTPLYTMNRRARDYYESLGICRTTVPVELNYGELCARGCEGEEIIVYGYLPLMVTAGCLSKNVLQCTGTSKELQLVDRYGKAFHVKNVCSECYNLIYNSQPLVLYDMEQRLRRLRPGRLRYNFTDESPDRIQSILQNPGENILSDFTRGHFNRGVE